MDRAFPIRNLSLSMKNNLGPVRAVGYGTYYAGCKRRAVVSYQKRDQSLRALHVLYIAVAQFSSQKLLF